MAPKWHQNGTKFAPKWHRNGTDMTILMWHQNWSKITLKWFKNGQKCTYFCFKLSFEKQSETFHCAHYEGGWYHLAQSECAHLVLSGVCFKLANVGSQRNQLFCFNPIFANFLPDYKTYWIAFFGKLGLRFLSPF